MTLNLQGIISSIKITDIIDILIVSYLVYKLLGFIRSSRAEQLAKGLIIIIGATFISSVCHFYAINWILTKILDVGLIALVVVFQPELRRALEYIGRGSFTSKNVLSREKAQDNVNTILRAVEYFSERKEGAIMVIERQTALQNIADTGTMMNASLSELAIENIFYKGSPLHDGAVILRGDKILAAGCVLPLTENTTLSKDLGTRHRAGIGISEVSDAVAVIVSEETGIISMAVDGRLSRFLDLKTVEKQLLKVYLSDVEGTPTVMDKVSSFIKGGKDEN